MIWIVTVIAIVLVLALRRSMRRHRIDNMASDRCLSAYRDLTERQTEAMRKVASLLRSAMATVGISHDQARELAEILDPQDGSS